MLNFVFADADGRIGWQTSGRLPIRSRGDGTFPFVVTDGQDNWSGWIPYEKMPASDDPRGDGWGPATILRSGAIILITTPRTPPPPTATGVWPRSWTGRGRRRSTTTGRSSGTRRTSWPGRSRRSWRRPSSTGPIPRSWGSLLERWDFRDRADQAAPLVFHADLRAFCFRGLPGRIGG